MGASLRSRRGALRLRRLADGGETKPSRLRELLYRYVQNLLGVEIGGKTMLILFPYV